MNWRLLNTNYNTAPMNMAIDEALLASKAPVLRFYRWKPAALSLGYFQSIKDIDIESCKKHNVDIVRRITGGKTVLHDTELTYSFIIDENKMPKSIVDSYKTISKGILIALKNLGLKPEMKKNILKKPNSAICFNEPSYYEIIVNNKKIVGSAQTRKQGKLLQHGSILIDIDIDKLVSLFNVNNKSETIAKSKERITSINNELNKSVTYEKVAEAMKKGFEENFNTNFINDLLNKEERKLAEKLANDKYSTRSWNFLK